MRSLRNFAVAAVLSAAAFAAPVFARADVILETASYTGADAGDYSIYATRWIGAAFTLDTTTEITSIGAQFGRYSYGTFFGAIIPISTITGLPDFAPTDIAADALASTVFSVPGGGAADLSEPLSVTLAAGSYAVVFGSGAFGADGSGGVSDDNDTIGTPSFVSYFDVWYGDTWSSDPYDGARLTVFGVAAVPEAATWAMITLGFLGLAFVSFRGGMRGSRALG